MSLFEYSRLLNTALFKSYAVNSAKIHCVWWSPCKAIHQEIQKNKKKEIPAISGNFYFISF